MDSEVPSPLEAWQMTRFVDTQLARFPLRSPGVPEGSYTMPTTWWPINQDYYIDDFAFARPDPLPVRVDLATGKIRVLKLE